MAHRVLRVYAIVDAVGDDGRFVVPGTQASFSWTIGFDKTALEFDRNDLSGVMDQLLKAVGVE
jgi:hypothetical protein